MSTVLGFSQMRHAASRLAGPRVALFWDGGCPLCRKEIAYYMWLDRDRKAVDWLDIDANPSHIEAHGVSVATAMDKIHALDRTSGEMLIGASAFLAVWREIPYWNILPPILTTVPGAMPIVDAAYGWWAKKRLGITAKLRSLEAGTSCDAKTGNACEMPAHKDK